jgi:hypothetical protein
MAITRMRWTTWIPWVSSGEEAVMRPMPQELQAGEPWPMPAQSIVRAWEDDDHVVDIEMRLGPDDLPIVTGIAVRRTVATEPRLDFKREPIWPDGATPRPLRPGDVQRLPLATIARAAVLWTESMKDDPESEKRAGKSKNVGRMLSRLKGARGGRARGTDFYRIVAQAHYKLVKMAVPHPAIVLGEQMGEDPNTVHQWLYRARAKGFRTG